jgi:hypothetical protein
MVGAADRVERVAWERLVLVMVYSLVAIAIAVASIVGAWGLTKEALKEPKA